MDLAQSFEDAVNKNVGLTASSIFYICIEVEDTSGVSTLVAGKYTMNTEI